MATRRPLYQIYAAEALESRYVYRVIPQTPATAEDFRSYAALGRDLAYAKYLRLMGVSTYRTPEEGAWAARKYDLGDFLAALELRRDRRITWSLTNTQTGHIEVWAPPEALLRCVVLYHEVEEVQG